MTIALPLNINLGAFSPALVVGDGEISFGEAKQAEGLINSLSGSSAGAEEAGQNAIKGNAANTKARGIITKGNPEAKVTKPKRASGTETEKKIRSEKSIPGQAEIPEHLHKRSLEKRDLAGFLAALKFADGALNRGPSIDLGTGEGGSGVGITIRPPGTQTKAAEE